MKLLLFLIVWVFLLGSVLSPRTALAQSAVVKKSNENRCYQESHPRFKEIKVFTPFKSLQACLDDGGRLAPGAAPEGQAGTDQKGSSSAAPRETPRPTPVL
ncbi:MAG: hypothetical protein K1X83_15530 [Oligoflexia bacterium]|nr:hypothetical protein [Oligoflexia bacterium]